MKKDMKSNVRRPDVIGIGCRRCASSWLHECLTHHPEIGKSPNGLHFFTDHYDRGESWYLEQLVPFGDRKVLMEFSVSYSYPEHLPVVCERIHRANREAKLFMLVRNPVDRAFSDYQRSVRRLELAKGVSFREAVKRHPLLLERGLYASIIKHYLRFFSRDRLCVLFYDDLASNPGKLVTELLDFIGVRADADLPLDPPVRMKKRTVRFRGLNKVLYLFKGMADGFFSLLRMKPQFDRFKSRYVDVYRRVLLLNTVPADIDDALRDELKEYYRDDIDELQKITGRDLDAWR